MASPPADGTWCTSPWRQRSPNWAVATQSGWMAKLMSNYCSEVAESSNQSKGAGVGGEGAAASICCHLCLLTSYVLLGAPEKPRVVPQIQCSFSTNSHTTILKRKEPTCIVQCPPEKRRKRNRWGKRIKSFYDSCNKPRNYEMAAGRK